MISETISRTGHGKKQQAKLAGQSCQFPNKGTLFYLVGVDCAVLLLPALGGVEDVGDAQLAEVETFTGS